MIETSNEPKKEHWFKGIHRWFHNHPLLLNQKNNVLKHLNSSLCHMHVVIFKRGSPTYPLSTGDRYVTGTSQAKWIIFMNLVSLVK